jgi:sugar transferase (PEP-CTERM/EpsH1 system associated)
LFSEFVPRIAQRLHCVENGVDTDFFSPERDYHNPYQQPGAHFVFTGAMDYWANIDAVAWFSTQILPLIRRRIRDAAFWIVGARPTREVRRLEGIDGVQVTGRVADTRPYLAHASAVVAPLRIARGVQNKVLEAMAMARAVVATTPAMAGIRCLPENRRWVADDPDAFAAFCVALVRDGDGGTGALARRFVSTHYRWEEKALQLERLIA